MTRQLQYNVFKMMVVAKSLRDTPDRSVCSISAAMWGPFEKAQEMTGSHCGFLASSNPSHGRDLGWQKETSRLPEAVIILEVTTTGKQIQVLELWNLETRQRRPSTIYLMTSQAGHCSSIPLGQRHIRLSIA